MCTIVMGGQRLPAGGESVFFDTRQDVTLVDVAVSKPVAARLFGLASRQDVRRCDGGEG